MDQDVPSEGTLAGRQSTPRVGPLLIVERGHVGETVDGHFDILRDLSRQDLQLGGGGDPERPSRTALSHRFGPRGLGTVGLVTIRSEERMEHLVEEQDGGVRDEFGERGRVASHGLLDQRVAVDRQVEGKASALVPQR